MAKPAHPGHIKKLVLVVGVVTLCLAAPRAWGHKDEEETIGQLTAVQGKVTLAHSGAPSTASAQIGDGVLFKDIIETQSESRTKALFLDDSVLTVGDHSRVEITEYIFDPKQSKRSVVVTLIKGNLRALVGKVFAGKGSKFEVHTPTAVAAARGTHFVVWVEGATSGVVNIGDAGDVDFSSGERTIGLAPHQFSVAIGGDAPTPPAVLTANVPAFVSSAVNSTELQNSDKRVTAKTAGAERGHTAGGAVPSSPPVVLSQAASGSGQR
jgi:hypothetical protein